MLFRSLKTYAEIGKSSMKEKAKSTVSLGKSIQTAVMYTAVRMNGFTADGFDKTDAEDIFQ